MDFVRSMIHVDTINGKVRTGRPHRVPNTDLNMVSTSVVKAAPTRPNTEPGRDG